MLTLLMAAGEDNWNRYRGPIERSLKAAGIDAALVTTADPDDVDYIIYAPSSSLQDFGPFRRCKAVLSLWAGVERIIGNPTLTQPLCRMVDPSLSEGMVEWVVGHVLRHHLSLDRYSHNPGQIWDPTCPPLARERKVAMLGVGVLGIAAAKTLAGLNFRVAGWSTGPKEIQGLTCHFGKEGLQTVLRDADFIVTLLPKTADTENLLNAERLGWCKPGAVILNPGRGALIDDTALLAALDSGQIGHATLDVFRVEPLPKDHPYWHHPKVTVTPHIAADTRPETSADVIVENIRRGETGVPFLNLASQSRGY